MEDLNNPGNFSGQLELSCLVLGWTWIDTTAKSLQGIVRLFLALVRDSKMTVFN